MNTSIDGLLLIDKPAGLTSHDVVAKARRALGTKSVGHAGTLDPLATGLLVLLVGKATKLSNFILNGQKGYQVAAKFGLASDSWDITGDLTEQPNGLSGLNEQVVRSSGLELNGDFQWPIPIFSAKKVNGKKLCDLARQGIDVEAPQKQMSFHNVEYLGSNDPSEFNFGLQCAKGGFVRTWVHMLGQGVGCSAVVSNLRRTWSAPYSVDRALPLADLEGKQTNGSHFIPLEKTLVDWEAIHVEGKDRDLLKNGQISHGINQRLVPFVKTQIQSPTEHGVRILDGETGKLLSLLQFQSGKGLKILRNFN